MPTAILPPASARRLSDISDLLDGAGEIYEDLLDQLALHDVVIAELVARVHGEGRDAGH
ncbi:hypothetical protein [Frankia sp. AgW1.1]|uniref:hypothetical protein n=1 Tax=Frankia sp. AgW1.1 TaxID=1836971 RepID=UPI001933F9F1|nr:hypothetical protein [Frankia sp. AgW1.1]MBL7487073.1 hypothetical protein [Frankia sp. AgW1.1]